MKRGLKLFVWEGFACDYTCGVAFALAETKEEAISLILGRTESPFLRKELLCEEPDVYETSFGCFVTGGS